MGEGGAGSGSRVREPGVVAATPTRRGCVRPNGPGRLGWRGVADLIEAERDEGFVCWVAVIELWVDAQAVHATGDIPILSGLFGGQLASGLKQILQQAF